MAEKKMQRFTRAQAEEECEEDGCMDFEADCDEMASSKQCFKVD